MTFVTPHSWSGFYGTGTDHAIGCARTRPLSPGGRVRRGGPGLPTSFPRRTRAVGSRTWTVGSRTRRLGSYPDSRLACLSDRLAYPEGRLAYLDSRLTYLNGRLVLAARNVVNDPFMSPD